MPLLMFPLDEHQEKAEENHSEQHREEDNEHLFVHQDPVECGERLQ